MQDSANVVNRQTLEGDPLGAALALQRVQLLARQPGPRRGDDQQPLIFRGVAERGDDGAAERAGEVQVVDDPHHRPLPRESARQLREQALEHVG